ncbi:hypothetical protein BTVI_155041 [Pitangus sulphuratus]|nr:hypothetical protein BTVI_155041 [Pitangus sulphuratus]
MIRFLDEENENYGVEVCFQAHSSVRSPCVTRVSKDSVEGSVPVTKQRTGSIGDRPARPTLLEQVLNKKRLFTYPGFQLKGGFTIPLPYVFPVVMQKEPEFTTWPALKPSLPSDLGEDRSLGLPLRAEVLAHGNEEVPRVYSMLWSQEDITSTG